MHTNCSSKCLRDSLPSTAQHSTILRRSPRFLHPKPTTPQPTTPPRRPPRKPAAKSQNPKTPRTPKSKIRRTKSLDCSRAFEQNNTPDLEPPATVLRKSQRLFKLKQRNAQPENPKTPKSNSRSNNAVRSGSRQSRVLGQEVVVVVLDDDDDEDEDSSPERVLKKSSSGSRKATTLRNVSDGFQTLRRSSRLGGMQNVDYKECDKGTSGRSRSKLRGSLDKGKDEMAGEKGKRVRKKSSVSVEGGEGKGEELDFGDERDTVRRKRKRGGEEVKVPKGWTKEQELALQRAYLLAKPTPGFWKQVARLVPGKSAQDCFDRIHSDHITPPQPQRRSRAKVTTNSSPLGGFLLSASKLLDPVESKAKRHGCNKQRNHLGLKSVRALLHKHYQVHQEFEAHLFSVLEPSVGPSTETSQPTVIPSTPTNSQTKQGFLHKSSQVSSVGPKKPLLRFSNSSDASLVSPPVLKQVKNKVLHEKYIDQLHIREAKRKTLSKNTQKNY